MNQIGVKITASFLGLGALYGVWQASSYNQEKQAQWANKGQQVVQEVVQPQPAVESQTDIPVIPLDNPTPVTQAVPIEQPQIPVTQAINIQPANTNNTSHEDEGKSSRSEKENNKEKGTHEKEEERD